jgi:uncharacterized caspase-like protein
MPYHRVSERAPGGDVFLGIGLAILLLLSCCLFSTDTLAAKRLALVIANSTYKNAIIQLPNPAHDAALISDRLRQLGFDVDPHENVSNSTELAGILHNFVERLDNETVALFYYAGHGLQYRRENFLVGVDARLTNSSSLQIETFPLNEIANLLENRAETTLLFWDACRNNPLANELFRTDPNGLSETSVGAAPVADRSGNTFVVLSAAAGKEALDGSGRYSPFAEALAKHITTPNVEVQQMLNQVAGEVMKITGGRQRPDRSSQLSHDFFFNAQDRGLRASEEALLQTRAALREAESQVQRKKQYRIVPARGAARDVVGIWRGAISGHMKVSFQAARSIG